METPKPEYELLMADLGQLSRIDPREVWKGEATDFTPWLAANLDRLAEVLGIELELAEREASVGSFSVDLVARDLGSDRVVIIENQLEPTDHTPRPDPHLPNDLDLVDLRLVDVWRGSPSSHGSLPAAAQALDLDVTDVEALYGDLVDGGMMERARVQ